MKILLLLVLFVSIATYSSQPPQGADTPVIDEPRGVTFEVDKVPEFKDPNHENHAKIQQVIEKLEKIKKDKKDNRRNKCSKCCTLCFDGERSESEKE